jgi:transposase-like protein
MKRGSRNGQKRYFCKHCHTYFSINHRKKEKAFWIPHMDGISFRKLGDEYGLSPAATYAHVAAELDELPDNTLLTKEYCEGYSGILILDGKFVKVRGYAQKIPFIYGIDYLTHDIPVIQLSRAESSSAFDTFFEKLKSCNYPLKIVVADDRSSIDTSLKRHFPEALIQRCQGHYLENIRQVLHVRTDQTHQHFFNSLKRHVFDEYKNEDHLNDALHHILTERTSHDPLCQAIVMDIDQRREQLFAYKNIPDCPPNTNLIELYNSHLNGRLKTIKGFKSFHGAERWLNGYIIRRRTKNLTDCGPKFKHLNGTSSFQQVLKKQAHWPDIFGIHAPETKR